MQIRSEQLLEALQARLIKGVLPPVMELSVSTDSRQIDPGMLFFALPGENYDGHDYAAAALQRGAEGAVVAREIDISENDQRENAHQPALLLVDDVQDSMQRLARAWLNMNSVISTAVTGSVGKTTTKDLIAHFLGTKYSTLKTQANFNNDIGLPLTVFSLQQGHERAVFEMAMRGPGEIKRLARIVEPQFAVITNIAPVHLETLGSLEAIAKAKCEVLEELKAGGAGMVNAENDLLVRTARAICPDVLTFGWNEDCDAQVVDVLSSPRGMKMELDILGNYLMLEYPVPAPMLAPNFAAAALCAFLQGISLDEMGSRLASFAASDKRLNIHYFSEGGAIINDSYNASPLSMSAALGTLMIKADGRRSIAVLGDMFELGSMEKPAHQALGMEAAASGVDLLVCIGERARDIAGAAIACDMPPGRVHHFMDRDSAYEYLRGQVDRGDFMLFKASRAMQLDKLAERFLDKE